MIVQYWTFHQYDSFVVGIMTLFVLCFFYFVLGNIYEGLLLALKMRITPGGAHFCLKNKT